MEDEKTFQCRRPTGGSRNIYSFQYCGATTDTERVYWEFVIIVIIFFYYRSNEVSKFVWCSY